MLQSTLFFSCVKPWCHGSLSCYPAYLLPYSLTTCLPLHLQNPLPSEDPTGHPQTCTLHCFSSCVELWRYITLLTPTMHLTTTTIEIRATLQSAQFLLLLLWSLETSSTWNCCSYSNSDRTLWWFSVDLMKGPSKWLNVRCYLCVLVCICLCVCINFLLMFVYLL